MKTLLPLLISAAVIAVDPLRAEGNGPIAVGVMVTLSGSVLGQHARDRFELALKQRGGQLGGRDVNLVVADDELKPDVAAARTRRLSEQDRADFVVGPIFSNVLAPIFRPMTGGNTILISPNAGASSFAGKDCNPNTFVTSYASNQVHGVMGAYAQQKGYGAELPGGARRGRRVQGPLQGRGSRRGLRAAHPTRFPGGLGAHRYRQAGRGVRLHVGRPWR